MSTQTLREAIRTESQRVGLPLGALLSISLVVQLLATGFSLGFFSSDEHFQVFEFAMARTGRAPIAEMPWEYASQSRQTLQPALVAFVMRLFGTAATSHPFLFVFLFKLLAAALAFAAGLALLRAERPQLDRDGLRALWLATLFLWCMPYLRLRFTGENLGGIALLLGVLLLLTDKRLSAGLLFGLSFMLRFQMAFAVVGVLLWLAWQQRERVRRTMLDFAWIAAGGLLAIGLAALVDRWFYGEWVFTPLTYFREQIINGRAATFGVLPWHFYAWATPLILVPPIGVALLVVAVVGGVKRSDRPWLWIVAAFVIAHTLVGRKEIRFLFPMVPLLPPLIAHGWSTIAPWVKARSWARLTVAALAVLNLALLALFATPAPYRLIEYDAYFFRALRQRPERILLHAGPSPMQVWGDVVHLYTPPQLRIVRTAQFDVPGALVYVEGRAAARAAERAGLIEVWNSVPRWARGINVYDWQNRRPYRYLFVVPE